MKTNTPSLFGTALRAATLGLGILFVATPASAQFRERERSRDSWGRSSTVRETRHHDGFRHDSDVRRRYFNHSRSNFTLSFGNGWAGRGYYFGPPSAAYYFQRPGVIFYRSWEAVPRAYRGYSYAPRNGNIVSVQQALARMGYYRGSIDGDIGPGTRNAIMRFEARNGMPVTGVVSTRLLRALNLY